MQQSENASGGCDHYCVDAHGVPVHANEDSGKQHGRSPKEHHYGIAEVHVQSFVHRFLQVEGRSPAHVAANQSGQFRSGVWKDHDQGEDVYFRAGRRGATSVNGAQI